MPAAIRPNWVLRDTQRHGSCFDAECTRPHPRRSTLPNVALSVRFPGYARQQIRYVQVYGHVWGAIEQFFLCMHHNLRSGDGRAPTIYVPLGATNPREVWFELFTELAVVFNATVVRRVS